MEEDNIPELNQSKFYSKNNLREPSEFDHANGEFNNIITESGNNQTFLSYDLGASSSSESSVKNKPPVFDSASNCDSYVSSSDNGDSEIRCGNNSTVISKGQDKNSENSANYFLHRDDSEETKVDKNKKRTRKKPMRPSIGNRKSVSKIPLSLTRRKNNSKKKADGNNIEKKTVNATHAQSKVGSTGLASPSRIPFYKGTKGSAIPKNVGSTNTLLRNSMNRSGRIGATTSLANNVSKETLEKNKIINNVMNVRNETHDITTSSDSFLSRNIDNYMAGIRKLISAQHGKINNTKGGKNDYKHTSDNSFNRSKDRKVDSMFSANSMKYFNSINTEQETSAVKALPERTISKKQISKDVKPLSDSKKPLKNDERDMDEIEKELFKVETEKAQLDREIQSLMNMKDKFSNMTKEDIDTVKHFQTMVYHSGNISLENINKKLRKYCKNIIKSNNELNDINILLQDDINSLKKDYIIKSSDKLRGKNSDLIVSLNAYEIDINALQRNTSNILTNSRVIEADVDDFVNEINSLKQEIDRIRYSTKVEMDECRLLSIENVQEIIEDSISVWEGKLEELITKTVSVVPDFKEVSTGHIIERELFDKIPLYIKEMDIIRQEYKDSLKHGNGAEHIDEIIKRWNEINIRMENVDEEVYRSLFEQTDITNQLKMEVFKDLDRACKYQNKIVNLNIGIIDLESRLKLAKVSAPSIDLSELQKEIYECKKIKSQLSYVKRWIDANIDTFDEAVLSDINSLREALCF